MSEILTAVLIYFGCCFVASFGGFLFCKFLYRLNGKKLVLNLSLVASRANTRTKDENDLYEIASPNFARLVKRAHAEFLLTPIVAGAHADVSHRVSEILAADGKQYDCRMGSSDGHDAQTFSYAEKVARVYAAMEFARLGEVATPPVKDRKGFCLGCGRPFTKDTIEGDCPAVDIRGKSFYSRLRQGGAGGAP